MPQGLRQHELQSDFGFSCSCERCKFEGSIFRSATPGSLEAWNSMYSCEVPGYTLKSGPVQVSRLEGLIADAERSAFSVFASCWSKSEPSARTAVRKQWLLWPLVSALSQLAARLAVDGRLSDGLAAWKKAEEACRSVLPHSNVHMRVLSEMLRAASSFR